MTLQLFTYFIETDIVISADKAPTDILEECRPYAPCKLPRQNSYLPVLLELISSFGFWEHNKSTGKTGFQRSLFYLAKSELPRVPRQVTKSSRFRMILVHSEGGNSSSDTGLRSLISRLASVPISGGSGRGPAGKQRIGRKRPISEHRTLCTWRWGFAAPGNYRMVYVSRSE